MNCGSSGAGTCGSGNLPSDLEAKIAKHPCFSEEAHHHYARIHLPVAPRCNIQCNYCNRLYDCVNESRPGVTSKVCKPQDAVKRVSEILEVIPQTTVVGIAGPGDPLANPIQTFTTMRMIKASHPDIKLCLSTNGLALVDHLDEIASLGVEHVTITVNAVDPEIGAKIYKWVYYGGKTYRDQDAADFLIQRQLFGLRGLVERNILVKCNVVMLPEVNADHIPEVVKTLRGAGAFLVNIMPLIPVEGSAFAGLRAPTQEELESLQKECQLHAKLMRHCRQCRADAVGLLGQDLSAELADPNFLKSGGAGGKDSRQEILAQVEDRATRQTQVKATLGYDPDRSRIRVAVATKGGGIVNQHFGHANEFLIYDVSPEGIEFVGHRKVRRYCDGPDTCGDEEGLLAEIIKRINDCDAVVCSQVGYEPGTALAEAGISSYLAAEIIEVALDQVARGLLEPVYGFKPSEKVTGLCSVRRPGGSARTAGQTQEGDNHHDGQEGSLGCAGTDSPGTAVSDHGKTRQMAG